KIMKPATVSLLLFRLGVAWLGGSHSCASASSDQRRVGGAGQNYDYNQQTHSTASGGQYSAKIPPKGGVTISSSASRARPDLLQWVKFW
uniref:Secreted protein n=1 Tax=Monodon monoceros TaxID=40151 RepID=A0A8C6AVN0_MONMO